MNYPFTNRLEWVGGGREGGVRWRDAGGEKWEERNRWRICAVAAAVEWWMLGSPDKGVHMA